MSVTSLFQKGQSGNPGGLTTEHRRLAIDFRYKCAREADKRLPTILEIIDDRDVSPNVRVMAWNILKDRGFGKDLPAAQDEDPSDMQAKDMTQSQLNMMIEGNFFGAVQDMLETQNARFLSLIDRQINKKDFKPIETDKTVTQPIESKVKQTEKSKDDNCNSKSSGKDDKITINKKDNA